MASFFLLLNAWAAAALYFDVKQVYLNIVLFWGYLLVLAAIWFRIKSRIAACALTLVCFAAVLTWWLFIPPSNHRDWQPDVAVLPYADIQGNHVTLHNIRYCKYRNESDFDVGHYDRVFDLARLRTLDFYLVYWGSPLIAHTMASFGFGDDQYVCISIETRKEKGEQYSALRGFFRQFELTYVIADERDLVRLRTSFRKEQVYLYRIRGSPEAAQALFLDYLQGANELYRKPRWYNALTDNCTTNIRVHAEHIRSHRAPLDWRVIVNGYSDQMLYTRGQIDNSLSFTELKKRSLINDLALKASETDFSKAIRLGLPGMN